VNRNAALGTVSTLSARTVSNSTVAVIPGSSAPSGLFTETTTV
jgi:hypothetical protein